MALLDEEQDPDKVAGPTSVPTAPGQDPLDALKKYLALVPKAPETPRPALPEAPDPEIARAAQERLGTLAGIQGFAGLRTIGTLGAMQGKTPSIASSPGYEAAKHAAELPVQQEATRVGTANKGNEILNKWMELQAARGVKEQTDVTGVLGKYLQGQNQQGVAGTRAASAEKVAGIKATSAEHVADTHAKATTDAATTRATSPETAINPVTGQPFNKHAAPQPSAPGAAPVYDKRMDKMLGDLRTDLSGVGRGDQRLKQQQQIYDRSDRLFALGNRKAAGGNLDQREIEELAIGLNSMLQGSNVGAQAQVKALVPQSVMGNAQKMIEWLTNEPRGLNQQAFVKRMMSAVQAERDLSSQKMQELQHERLPAHIQAFRLFPDESAGLLNSYGIPAKVKDHKLYVQHPDGTVEEF